MTTDKLAELAKFLGYYTRVEDDRVVIFPDVGQHSPDIHPSQLLYPVIFDPYKNNGLLFDIIDAFEWFAIERPMRKQWVVEYRKNLLQDELGVFISKVSREDAIIRAAYQSITE